MKAALLVRNRIVYGDEEFAEVVVWELPAPLPGSTHCYKYRLAFVAQGVCVIRYDNESGKGDHQHQHDQEQRYSFETLEKLFSDFERDIRSHHDEDRHS